MSETPLARLAGHLVGEPIGPWIRSRRPEKKTWRAIAAELKQATDGQIDVPPQTLINWSPDPPPSEPVTEEIPRQGESSDDSRAAAAG